MHPAELHGGVASNPFRALVCAARVLRACLDRIRQLQSPRYAYPRAALPLGFDVSDALERVTRATPSELSQIAADLMGTYPNTYMLAKSMAEHLVVREVGVNADTGASATGFPLVIYRPTIIGAAWKEPSPGWVDQLAGAGTIFAAIGMGNLTILPGNPRNITDVVPVDLAANSILLSVCARIARGRRAASSTPVAPPTSEPLIVHCGTSDPRQNPLRLGTQFDTVANYFRKSPPRGSMFPVKFRMIENPERFQMQWFLSYAQPLSVYSELASKSGNAKEKKMAALLSQRMQRARRVVEVYEHFTENQWVFLSDATFGVLREFVSPTLWVGTHKLDWERYLINFCVGLKKYVLREPKETPVDVAREQPPLSIAGLAAAGQEHRSMSLQPALSKL